MSKLIKNIFDIKKSNSYIEYNKYHVGNILGITKMSRRELMHSNFIAWLLEPTSSHTLGYYPIYQLVKAFEFVYDKKENENSRLDMDNIYKFYDDDFITDVTIRREQPVKVGTQTKYIDILIEIKTKEKVLPIIIENKVDSKENGANADQTLVYSNWGENRFGDRNVNYEPIYIFLYPEYNSKVIQKDNKYIRMTYQELVDYIIEPSMQICGDINSVNNFRIYLQCLSFQADNEKGEYTMAISKEERNILDKFIVENKNLLCAVLHELQDEFNDPSVISKITNSFRDYSTYQFNGVTYRKGKLVLAVVTEYVNANANLTYDDLKDTFDITVSFDKKPLIRRMNDLSSNEKKNKRAFIDEPITLSDGTIVVVNSQVQSIDMPEIIQIATNLGYSITKNN